MRRSLPVTLAIVIALAVEPMATLGQPASPEAVPAGTDATRGSPPAIRLSTRGAPLIAGRDGERVTAIVELDRPTDDLELWVATYGGRKVKQLADGPRAAGTLTRTWNGRDDKGERLPVGAYRIVASATADGAQQRASEWVTVAERRIYPRRPGFITIAVDPGHGGSYSGALGKDGSREADFNLDIAMRLASMLEGAGVNVVITRTSDSDINAEGVDLTGDGVADSTDELAIRTDIANRARADLFVSVHNNTAVNLGVGGPSTYFYDRRPFSTRSARLARTIQRSMMEALSALSDDGWEPFDHGALVYPYYVLRGYDPPRLRRPTQMPGVLSEGLFLSNPRELRMLKRANVRQAMAQAYYDAIAAYLAGRATQIGYRLVDAPESAVAGEPVTFDIEVRNTGNEPMRGWHLVAGSLPAPAFYEGRGRLGRPIGRQRIPRLEPGDKVTLSVEVTAPDPGERLLVFDARDREGRRLSRRGSPMLQVPLTVLEPAAAPSAEPSPVPTGSTV